MVTKFEKVLGGHLEETSDKNLARQFEHVLRDPSHYRELTLREKKRLRKYGLITVARIGRRWRKCGKLIEIRLTPKASNILRSLSAKRAWAKRRRK